MASASANWVCEVTGLRSAVNADGVVCMKPNLSCLQTSFLGSFRARTLRVGTPSIRRAPLQHRVKCEKDDDLIEHVSVERPPYYSYLDSTSGQLEPASGARASIPGEEYWPEGTASRVRAARAPEPTGKSLGSPSFGKNPGSRRKKYRTSVASSQSQEVGSESRSDSEPPEVDVEPTASLEEPETPEDVVEEPKDVLSEYVVYQTEPEVEEETGYELDKKLGRPHPFVDPKVKKSIEEPLTSEELWWNWRKPDKEQWSRWQRRRPDSETVFLKAMAETGQVKLYGDHPTLTETSLYRARRHIFKGERLQAEQERLERIGPIAFYSEWVKEWKRDTSREAVQKHYEETGEDENTQLIEMFQHQTDREYRIMMGTDFRIRRDPLAMRMREDQIKQIWGGDPVYPTVNYIQDPNEVIDYITVNGSFPGPEIRVHKGDTVFVTVKNQGNYGVTLHWHGVKQPRNPWSDGPENITQCPIPVNTSFTQQIIFSDEEGTLWWHAHSDWTRATVHGPIIILPNSKSGYPHKKPDAEQTIVLGEWYKGDVMAIIDEALATGGDPNLSDAFTINGQPGDLYNCSSNTTFSMLVDQGKTYLLRIISAVMNEEIFFGIAKHNLTVVGMDGAYLKPITVKYIMIAPGQTMNVLVTANQSKSFYYMAGSPFADTTAPFDNTTTTGILQYRGASRPASIAFPSLPVYNNKSAVGNFTKLLRSLGSSACPVQVPVNITRRIFMTVSVNQIECPDSSCDGPDGNRLSASLNNISFVSPTIDVLQAYYRNISGVYNATFPDQPPYYFNFTGDVGNNTVYPSLGTRAISVKYGAAVEIILQGTNIGAAENHPMHLHGFSFYVVGMGEGNFNNKTSPSTYNLVDPPLINTVGLPKNGWTTIRFVANNPGVWFMHCHLERHASWGMNTVLIVTNGGTSGTSMLPPPSYMPPCS